MPRSALCLALVDWGHVITPALFGCVTSGRSGASPSSFVRYVQCQALTGVPRPFQELADREIADEPRNSNYVRTVDRCVATSRPRGVVQPWRLSRIMFRHLADYNQLSGVLRAKW
ncbi:28S ribosomal protein S14, mitochondrial [Amphibalanus amphitrite]|uniref:28S ribosomal protein S14, mitochondrial n=1 Tax=Amphibalanus amphitrite TaxID=1232801 RepID=A0A6A4VSQ7_AMPAM|nr:28S ribosomal protein S14, mitochondrial [Amphibalanus amphitrite]